MAQIDIEPKPRRGALPFILGLLLIVAIAAAVWWFMQREPAAGEGGMAPPVDTIGWTAGGSRHVRV